MASDVAHQREEKHERLLSIQVLRGIAAFLVVLFHCAEIQRDGLGADRLAERNLLSGFWDQGYAGVDIFFVISGFVMVWVSQKYTRQDIGRFIYNRATRIYPIWWVFAIIAGLYYMVSYGQFAPPDRYGAEEGLVYFIKSLLLIPQNGVPVLVVGWTLIHEMFFYVVFAVLLLFPKKYLPLYLLAWAGVTLCLFFAGLAKPMIEGVVSLSASLLTLEFIAGALLACFLKGSNIRYSLAVFLSGVVLMVCALFLYTERTTEMLLWGRVLVYTGPTLMILAGFISLERTKRFQINIWFSRLGDWSYGLYLSHILVILAMKRIFLFMDPYLPDGLRYLAEGWLDNVFFWSVSITACLVFSALSYRFVEQPLLRQSRKLYA